MTRFTSLFFASFVLGSVALGCSAADSVTNHFTCNDVCQTYADCFDSNYDVGECKNRCEDKANDSNRKQDSLDECHACIKDKSCVADIASCSGSCGNFVP